MTTHLPSPDEPSLSPTHVGEGPRELVSSQLFQPPSTTPSDQAEESFYTFEDEPFDLIGTPWVAPFELSNEMPSLSTQAQSSSQAAAIPAAPSPIKQPGKKHLFSLPMIAVFICVAILVGMLLRRAQVQLTPSPQPNPPGRALVTHQVGSSQQQGTTPSSQAPTPTVQGQGQSQAPPSSPDWVPQQLPAGWTNAGLAMADDLQALRTAVSFNDREMSLDYRSVGTRDLHAGTFTAATFILTPAAKQRFGHNDVRMINNALFDLVSATKLIRVVVNPQPQVIKFAQQGQQQFAWVDVSFQFWQSQIDPTNPDQWIGGKDSDPATNQPRTHHMAVLLLRVTPEDAGANPAMGGTGWLVSNYALDPVGGSLPEIVQPA